VIDVVPGKEAIIVIGRRWKRCRCAAVRVVWSTSRWAESCAPSPARRHRPTLVLTARRRLRRRHYLIHIWWRAKPQRQQQDGRCIQHRNAILRRPVLYTASTACWPRAHSHDSLYSARPILTPFRILCRYLVVTRSRRPNSKLLVMLAGLRARSW